MPNIKSAIKRMRSNARKTLVNTPVTSSMATAVKKVEKNPTKETLQVAVKRIDKAVANGSIKQNRASRLKSRLTKAVNNTK